jgi:hypothetical protein
MSYGNGGVAGTFTDPISADSENTWHAKASANTAQSSDREQAQCRTGAGVSMAHQVLGTTQGSEGIEAPRYVSSRLGALPAVSLACLTPGCPVICRLGLSMFHAEVFTCLQAQTGHLTLVEAVAECVDRAIDTRPFRLTGLNRRWLTSRKNKTFNNWRTL